MKRIMLVLAAIIAVIAPAFAFAPAASAATGIISNGTGWTPRAGIGSGAANGCTIGVVGTDSSGNKIAISAAHCVDERNPDGTLKFPDGSPVYKFNAAVGAGVPIGTVAHRDLFVDYVVIKLNSDADLRSNGPAARIDSIGPAWPSGILCKDGIATGVRCGAIVGGDANRINALTFVGSGGDSGGPAWSNGTTQIIGLGRGLTDFVRFSAVQGSIAAQGNPAGKGFVVTNN